jgi:hypothetical protein
MSHLRPEVQLTGTDEINLPFQSRIRVRKLDEHTNILSGSLGYVDTLSTFEKTPLWAGQNLEFILILILAVGLKLQHSRFA